MFIASVSPHLMTDLTECILLDGSMFYNSMKHKFDEDEVTIVSYICLALFHAMMTLSVIFVRHIRI